MLLGFVEQLLELIIGTGDQYLKRNLREQPPTDSTVQALEWIDLRDPFPAFKRGGGPETASEEI